MSEATRLGGSEGVVVHSCNQSICSPRFESNVTYLEDYSHTLALDCDGSPSGGVLSSRYFHALVYTMYCSIFLIALLGNGLVCYVVYYLPRMRTVTNLFIANLAVGDILMTVFCIPFSFVTTLLLQYWPFGRAMCSTVSYSQAISVFVSAYTLVAISIDRFMAIMWPLKPRMGKRQAKVIILIVWLVALLTAQPIPWVSRIEYPSDWHLMCNKGLCHEVWDDEKLRALYSMTLLVLQYVIPLMVLILTYSCIAVMVWGKRPPGEAENGRDQRLARSKRKMVKMMVIVVVVFTICWLPLNVLNIVWERNPGIGSWSGLPFLWFAFHWLAMSHTCYNPVIYCWMNSKFRAGFATVLHIPPTRYHQSSHHSGHEHTGPRRSNNTTITGMSSRRDQKPLPGRYALYRISSATYKDDRM